MSENAMNANYGDQRIFLYITYASAPTLRSSNIPHDLLFWLLAVTFFLSRLIQVYEGSSRPLREIEIHFGALIYTPLDLMECKSKELRKKKRNCNSQDILHFRDNTAEKVTHSNAIGFFFTMNTRARILTICERSHKNSSAKESQMKIPNSYLATQKNSVISLFSVSIPEYFRSLTSLARGQLVCSQRKSSQRKKCVSFDFPTTRHPICSLLFRYANMRIFCYHQNSCDS